MVISSAHKSENDKSAFSDFTE